MQNAQDGTAAGPIVTLLLITAGVCFYFLPAIVAATRKKRSAGAIFALNFFLGWTFIGWVVALVWALSADPPQAQPVMVNVVSAPNPTVPSYRNALPGAPFCPHCGNRSDSPGAFCPHCGAAKRPQITA